MNVLGVDGCKSGWFYVLLTAQGCEYGVVEKAEQLLALNAEYCLLDMPIGLVEAKPLKRDCDVEARKRLGPRRNSVFWPPCRQAVYAKDYADALAINEAVTGQRIAPMCWNIVPKIREIDVLMQASQAARDTIRECHPELAFWALNDGEPMQHYKKRADGFCERMEVLSKHLPEAEDIAAKALLWLSDQGVARDDIVDALCLAVTASRPLGSVPRDPPDDPKGLSMEMVYAVVVP